MGSAHTVWPTWLAITLAVGGCASSETMRLVGDDQILYLGPRFESVSGPAEAILVDDAGRIARVFARLDEVPETLVARREILPGVVGLPGLIDAHLHVAWLGQSGQSKEQLDLAGARSLAEVRARLEAFAAAHPEVQVIVGHGWDHTLWGAELPGADDLGPLERPAMLWRVDGHALWLNRAAMMRAKTFFADPPQDERMRVISGDDGPTGVVVDPARALISLVKPPPTDAELRRWIDNGLAACAEVGLVEVHDMATSPRELAQMQALAAAGPLPVRVVSYLDGSEESFAWIAEHPGAPRVLGPDLVVAGIKIFADGALGSRGAALKADYTDEPGHRGQPADLADLVATAERAARHGFPVAIHAIGDLGNDHALTAIEAANAVASQPLVHRIEHAQVIDPADFERFVAGGVIASMQPTHATSDMRWAEARVGPERIKGAYAWRTLLGRGVTLAFGSDAPVESHDPRLGLFAAMFRQTPEGEPSGGWRPEEALGWAQALDAFSAGAVQAAPGGDRRGRLEVGAPFEVTLMDRDVVGDPRSLLLARAVGTVRDGLLRARSP